MDGWMDGWTWMDMDGCIDEQMNGYEWMDGWMDG
jgi:hypothetical protein